MFLQTYSTIRCVLRLTSTKVRPHWATAIALVLFIGMQVALAGHLHADDCPISECSVCQFEHDQSAPSAQFDAAHAQVAGTNAAQPPLSFAPLSLRYRLNARGPPLLS